MSEQARALIIDDEADLRQLLNMTLSRMGMTVVEAENVAGAKQHLAKQRFDLCFTDLRLPDGNGLEIVRTAAELDYALPIAVLTAYGNTDCAVEALKLGAFDFVAKPIQLEALRDMVRHALALGDAPAGNYPTHSRFSSEPDPQQACENRLLGQSLAIERVRDLIVKLARSQAPIYIGGESGVGKELAARLIHDLGPRRQAPFIAVNCGAIPGELMESEFFGHTKGAFTGANRARDGLFRAAHGGTLLLDEIADLPLAMQVKLLRALQEKRIRPIGSHEEVAIDVRVLCATHKDLAAEVRAGRFRQDLFFRLNVIELKMPPLRERREDIPMLAEHVLARLADRWETPQPTLSESAHNRLKEFDYPGNVRELENILERAATICEDNTISMDDLMAPSTTQAAPDSSLGATRPSHMPLDDYLAEIERQAINDALAQTSGHRTRAAKLLGISFRSLRYKIDKLGIDAD